MKVSKYSFSKVLQQLWSDRVIRLTFQLSLLVTALLNTPYYLTFKPHSSGTLALALCGSLVAGFSFFLLLTLHRVVLFALFPPVLLACATAYYFLRELGVYVNENTLGLVFETNWGEARDLIGGKLIATLAVSSVLGFFFLRALHRAMNTSSMQRRLALALGLFALHLTAATQSRAIEVYDPPLGLLTNSYVYLREQARVNDLLQSRVDISTEARLSPGADKADDDLTVILIIGETVRPDHLHLNGYPRQTTPELEKLGVVTFPDVITCATNTRFAVPCLLSRGTRRDLRRPYHETSLISVYQRLGFDSSWLSMQGKFLEAIVPDQYTVAATAAIAKEAGRVVYLNPTGNAGRQKQLDTELLPVLDESLASANPRKLVVLHTAGAHFHYTSRYPASQEKFQPVCLSKSPRDCEPSALNNTYDNAMLFLDTFLAQVIRRVENINAFVFYVADHGESLGENGAYLHHLDSPDPEQNRVAMLAWASRAFQERHRERWEKLIANSQKKLSHDHVFHTLLDCIGVELPALDRTLSLCRNVHERSEEFAANRLSFSF